MTRTRLDGLYFLLIGTAVFVLLGAALERASTASMVDFKMMYYPSRCLMQHCDPYRESEVMRIYETEGGSLQSDNARERQIVTRFVYLPTAFSLTVLFAILPWGPAHMIWMALTFVSLVFASFLIWNLAADYAPIASGILIGCFLANSEVLIITGTAAGIVISLSVFAVWCLLRERFVTLGILCLAISLAVKPQDAGLVWLYFLLAGGVHRRRALQILLATVALSLPAILWVWYVSPHWIQELHSNMSAYFAQGGINDPGLGSTGAYGLAMVISLQAFLSVFWDSPRMYNSASYLLCGPLLLLWAFVTLRSSSSPKRAWLAIAAIAPLSMLPVYHRQYDAKLLLLTIPACAMLWAEGGLIGRLALLVNTAGLVLTGDLSWAFFFGIINSLHLPATVLSRQLLRVMQVFPVPLILLVMGVFYLWIYARRKSAPAPFPAAVGPDYSGSPVAVEGGHRSAVAFSLRKSRLQGCQ